MPRGDREVSSCISEWVSVLGVGLARTEVALPIIGVEALFGHRVSDVYPYFSPFTDSASHGVVTKNILIPDLATNLSSST